MNKRIFHDKNLCVGCEACSVACMDQNDLYPEKGQMAYRRIYRVEQGQYPDVSIQFSSVACMHCKESPCIKSCKANAITKDSNTGAVVVNSEQCIGCRNCESVCPFGVPRYDALGKMHKCNMCNERIKVGLKPACVRVCPIGALKFESINRAEEERVKFK